jgi:hypothetical protein
MEVKMTKKEFDPFARYFIGKFGKEEGRAKLTEVNKAFVLFRQESDGSLMAIHSNTDVKAGENWDYEEESNTVYKFKANERSRVNVS